MADAVAIFTPGQRMVDQSGVPYANCTAEFYIGGTGYTDPKTIYADADLATQLGVIAYFDSAGYPVTANGGSTKTLIYTDTGSYDIIIKDSAGVTIASHPNVKGAVISGSSGGGAATITQAQADVRYTRNANALAASSSILDADIVPFWRTAGAANNGITYANFKATLTTDFRADGRMFPVGTRMLFQQTTPPTGWTKEAGAAYNDATLRFTTGTAATGGSASFNTTFASRTFTGTVGNDTPNQAKTATHQHTVDIQGSVGVQGGATVAVPVTVAAGSNTSSIGSGTAHNHTLTMDAAAFAVKFAEVTIGIKA